MWKVKLLKFLSMFLFFVFGSMLWHCQWVAALLALTLASLCWLFAEGMLAPMDNTPDEFLARFRSFPEIHHLPPLDDRLDGEIEDAARLARRYRKHK